MRILIIDDDQTFCRYLSEVLTDLGHTTTWVSDGLLGFEQCLRESYDVVVCDVRMPLILGTELLAELRHDRPDQCFILISAFADEHLEAHARAHRAFLISKPFEAPALTNILQDITTQQGGMQKELLP